MSDEIKLEQAARILLAHPHSTTSAAAELLRAALEGRPFTAKAVSATCKVCGDVRSLPLGELIMLGVCDHCLLKEP